MTDSPAHADLPRRLLAWYDRQARVLPWRFAPGMQPDPYRVWLSEIMLQQTTVAAVKPYFQDFLRRWPTVGDLAAAPLDDVLTAWAGLGYYARARNLHAGARAVVERHGGRFPDTEAELRALPGVGPYTAAAVAAIAFGRKATAVDGNVERVMARIFAVTEPLPGAKRRLTELAATLTPDERPGDYLQAVMDLGATVCTPRRPKCMLCPWSDACAARAGGIEEDLPAKRPRAPRPVRHGIAFWLTNGRGEVLLRRRPPTGLLGGMLEVPSTEWGDALPADPLRFAPSVADWRALPGDVRHVFSHFELRLHVWVAQTGSPDVTSGIWTPVANLAGQALPSAMVKVARHALRHAGAPR